MSAIILSHSEWFVTQEKILEHTHIPPQSLRVMGFDLPVSNPFFLFLRRKQNYSVAPSNSNSTCPKQESLLPHSVAMDGP